MGLWRGILETAKQVLYKMSSGTAFYRRKACAFYRGTTNGYNRGMATHEPGTIFGTSVVHHVVDGVFLPRFPCPEPCFAYGPTSLSGCSYPDLKIVFSAIGVRPNTTLRLT